MAAQTRVKGKSYKHSRVQQELHRLTSSGDGLRIVMIAMSFLAFWKDASVKLINRFLLRNWLVCLCVVGLAVGMAPPLAAEDTAVVAKEANKSAEEAAVEHRLDEAIRYLASDELEGRGLATNGINTAADYLAEQFRTMGLKTDLYDGTPFQVFETTISSKLGPAENNHARLTPTHAGDKPVDWKLGKDFQPLGVGGSAEFDLPLVFAGYGISVKAGKGDDFSYDDYESVDVKGKAVIILRHEPQQLDPHSPFDGTRDSQHAPIARKISNAYQHGAEAVLLVTDEVEIRKKVDESVKAYQKALDAVAKANDEFKAVEKPSAEVVDAHRKKIDALLAQARAAGEKIEAERDPLFAFDRGGDATESRRFPVLHVRREAIDPVVKAALGSSFGELEKQIDDDLKPRSRELTGWRLAGRTDVERVEVPIKNVVAVLEGEGPLANETIVVGAHYDHLGRGESGSAAPGSKEIHNGADDNASGTVAMLEVARQLASREKKLPRRVVFIAFTGEERGLLGSAKYVHDPLFPIENTVAMLNMDMVGRMKDDELVVYGTGTATEFNGLVDTLNAEHGFKIKREAGGFGPSDHSSFYAMKIPVLHFFTGLHNDYHRPSDDSNKVNLSGMRRVSEMVTQAVVSIAETEARPTYASVAREGFRRGQATGDRPYFGSIPNLGGGDDDGYAIQGVSGGGPAEKGGLKGGDVIVRFGDSKIGNLADFDSALRKYKGGDSVPVVVRRDGQEVKLEVTLEAPR
jgi:peptidase M28-like protein/PDZ domain-containing protein